MLKVSDYFQELHLRRDSQVADFGCGSGENVKYLAEKVVDGKVFAVEIVKEKLEYLEEEIVKHKEKDDHEMQNIIPVWGNIEELEGTRLRDDSVDSILISNTFFLLKHKKTCIMEMKRVLKKYGKILFIDWHKHIGNSMLHKDTVLKESDVIQIFTEAGFLVHPGVFKDEHHFVLLIEKK